MRISQNLKENKENLAVQLRQGNDVFEFKKKIEMHQGFKVWSRIIYANFDVFYFGELLYCAFS